MMAKNSWGGFQLGHVGRGRISSKGREGLKMDISSFGTPFVSGGGIQIRD